MQLNNVRATKPVSKSNTSPVKYLMRLAATKALLSAIVLSSCQKSSQTYFDDTQMANGIVGGSKVEEQTDSFSKKFILLAIGVQKIKTSAGEFKSAQKICTATAISAQVLITAAHCVQNITTTQINAVLSLNPWNHLPVESEWLDITEIRIHPQFEDNGEEVKNDLALLKIKQSLPSDRIAKFAQDVPKENNLILQLAGYGKNSTLKSANQINILESSLLNKTSKSVDHLDSNSAFFKLNQRDQKGVCVGDSGAGVFITNTVNKENLLIGLVSFVSMTEQEKNQIDPFDEHNLCIGDSYITNLLMHKSWISKNLNELNAL